MPHPYSEESLTPSSSISVSRHPSRSRCHERKAAPMKPFAPNRPPNEKPLPARPAEETELTSSRHFIKQENIITLVLAGHTGDSRIPMYTSGSIVSGLVTLSKVSSIISVEVRMEGSIRVREVAGGGSGSTQLLSDTLYSWDHQLHEGPAPYEFTFRAQVPTYHEGLGRGRQLLPPSFDSRLTAIPGFRVSVQYEFVVAVTRVRMGPLLWRRQTRLRVPFTYKPLTRPPISAPLTLRPNTSKRGDILFNDMISSADRDAPPIETQIYLPGSQITPITERINFRITLSAPDVYLTPFLLDPTPLSSFHPIASSQSVTSLASSLPGSVRQPLLGGSRRPGPVRVSIERHITADARATGVVVLHPKGRFVAARTPLAEGLVFQAERGPGWVSWWGEVSVPPDVQCCGFMTDKLSVKDVLVLHVNAPAVHTHVLPFRQSVPLRLTSCSAKSTSATKVYEV
ncbi:hypothetical protein DENSPDRAFT_636827 [Dentipellis sp. KUC8613]|nr:hypothetical protein DENSPDRAFT_636827 [Dentipellis sp. KUC8613]